MCRTKGKRKGNGKKEKKVKGKEEKLMCRTKGYLFTSVTLGCKEGNQDHLHVEEMEEGKINVSEKVSTKKEICLSWVLICA